MKLPGMLAPSPALKLPSFDMDICAARVAGGLRHCHASRLDPALQKFDVRFRRRVELIQGILGREHQLHQRRVQTLPPRLHDGEDVGVGLAACGIVICPAEPSRRVVAGDQCAAGELGGADSQLRFGDDSLVHLDEEQCHRLIPVKVWAVPDLLDCAASSRLDDQAEMDRTDATSSRDRCEPGTRGASVPGPTLVAYRRSPIALQLSSPSAFRSLRIVHVTATSTSTPRRMSRLAHLMLHGAGVMLAALLASTVQATPLAAQSPPITAIRADRLIVGDGTIIDRPVVLVQGDRFLAVGPAATTPIPRGARIIDLPGHTLLPGLIDCHTHINSSDADGGDMAVLRETGAHAAIYGVVNARKTLDAGFTTIRDVGATNGADIALRDLIAKGVVPGPRIFAAGPSLGITGGHADVNGWSPLVQIPGTGLIVDGVDGMRTAVRLNVKYGSDHIKITATGGILSVGDAVNHAQYSEEELRAAVDEATRLGRKVAMHAHGAEGIVTAVRAGAASIEHGSLIDDEGIALMKEKGTYLVPTLIILDEIARDGEKKGVPASSIAKARAIEPERRVRLRHAWESGVRFAFGTDATGDIHGRNAEEFSLMHEQLGATPMQAIRSATSAAADLIGVADQLGTVGKGKLADLIAVEGNPLDDLHRLEHVRFVMKAGEVYKGAVAPGSR